MCAVRRVSTHFYCHFGGGKELHPSLGRRGNSCQRKGQQSACPSRDHIVSRHCHTSARIIVAHMLQRTCARIVTIAPTGGSIIVHVCTVSTVLFRGVCHSAFINSFIIIYDSSITPRCTLFSTNGCAFVFCPCFPTEASFLLALHFQIYDSFCIFAFLTI